jgi:hypothetical protein
VSESRTNTICCTSFVLAALLFGCCPMVPARQGRPSIVARPRAVAAPHQPPARLFVAEAPSQIIPNSPADWTILSSQGAPFPTCEHPTYRREDGKVLRIQGPNRQLLLATARPGPLFAFEGASRLPLPISALAYWPLGNNRYRFLLRDGQVVESDDPLGEATVVEQTLRNLDRATVGKRAILAMRSNRLFRSTDGMQHWQEVTLPVPAQEPFEVTEFRMNPKGEGWIRFRPERLLLTRDDGASFALARPRAPGSTGFRADGIEAQDHWQVPLGFAECAPVLGAPPEAHLVDSALLEDGWAGLYRGRKRWWVAVAHGSQPPRVTPSAAASCHLAGIRAFETTLVVLCGHLDGSIASYFGEDDGQHFVTDPVDPPWRGGYRFPHQWQIGPYRSLIFETGERIYVRGPTSPDGKAQDRWTELDAKVRSARFDGKPTRLWVISEGENGLDVASSALDPIRFEHQGTLVTAELFDQSGAFDLHPEGLNLVTSERHLLRFDARGHLQQTLDVKYLRYLNASLPEGRAIAKDGAYLSEWEPQAGHFRPFQTVPDYSITEAKCNLAGCLFENSYRRGWDVPLGERNANLPIAGVPRTQVTRRLSCRASEQSAGTLMLLGWDDPESSELAGLCEEPDGGVAHFSLDPTGKITKLSMMGPNPDAQTQQRRLDNGTLLRYRALSAKESEVAWTKWDAASHQILRQARGLPISTTELDEVRSVLTHRGWTVFALSERQLVVPPKGEPHFLSAWEDGSFPGDPFRFLFSGAQNSVWGLRLPEYSHTVTFYPLAGGSPFTWHLGSRVYVEARLEPEGIVLTNKYQKVRAPLLNGLKHRSLGYRWVVDPRRIPRTIPDPIDDAPSPSNSSGVATVVSVAWDNATIALHGSPTDVTLEASDEIVSIDVDGQGMLTIPRSSPDASIVVYDPGTPEPHPISWSTVHCAAPAVGQ